MTTPEPSPRRRPRVGTVLAALMLVVGVASLGLTPVRTDHDVFWHLKTGQMIAEGGERAERLRRRVIVHGRVQGVEGALNRRARHVAQRRKRRGLARVASGRRRSGDQGGFARR